MTRSLLKDAIYTHDLLIIKMEIFAEQFSDFHAASQAVLQFLHDRLGFGLWMVTRTEGEQWIVLKAEDHEYGVADGDVFQWLDSYCSRMVSGLGPRVAPRSDDVPAYAAAPIGQQVSISAYIGVPITRPNGALFGTLCAIDPEPQPHDISDELPLIELLANLLAKILATELVAQSETRRAEQANRESMTDPLTGLFNRRGWHQLMKSEEARCKRFAHPACVFCIDVDGLKNINDTQGHSRGDECLIRVARVLKKVARESDIVARLGGDEFAILAVDCDAIGARAVKRRINSLLAATSTAVSTGFAIRSATTTLGQAMQEADELMYLEKRQRNGRCDPA